MTDERKTLKQGGHMPKKKAVQNYIVRTYSAGVFHGEIAKRVGKEVTMRNARRLWYWKGAASLLELAVRGTRLRLRLRRRVM